MTHFFYIHLLLGLVLAFPALATPSILVFGDSLSAGYGIERGQEWPVYLQKRLNDTKLDYTIANHSVSGETTAGGVERLPYSLEQIQPQILILALGANDGLRGLSVKQMKENLQYMIDQATAKEIPILLVGMHIPTNYGPAYTQLFHQQYTALAETNKLQFLPFLLDKIGDDISQFQADGLHPNATAQIQIADNVWQALQPMLSSQ